jgi:hypothetical protein
LQKTVIPLFDTGKISELSQIGVTMAEQGRAIPLDNYFAAYLGNLVLIFGTLTGLVYFYFSKEHKGVFGRTAKIGIYFYVPYVAFNRTVILPVQHLARLCKLILLNNKDKSVYICFGWAKIKF